MPLPFKLFVKRKADVRSVVLQLIHKNFNLMPPIVKKCYLSGNLREPHDNNMFDLKQQSELQIREKRSE